ncbi:hypothetical protein [Streptomyces sp. Da 82-17]|uniref:hypothetical protein n=1 Tax=Streptomyces sp. Da 82-17 TaxID=3377116 RepID=UPI0038D3A365
MGRRSPGRPAQIVFHDVAREQVENMSPAELDRLEPVLDTIAANPKIGVPSKNGSIREHRDGVVRVVYVPTALGTLILIAYVEAG